MQLQRVGYAFVVVACQVLLALAVSPSAAGQTANLSTTSLSFGNQTVGTSSAAQVVTVTNTGSATLNFTSTAILGADRLDWAPLSNKCGAHLLAGDSCNISATFTPQATGARSGTIQMVDNAANSPQVVTVSGTGTAPAVSWSVPNLSFGTETVGETSASQTVTLTNTGTGTLNITSIAASGDYSQTNHCSAPIAPNGTCTVTVSFTPSAAWARMGTVAVTSNAIAPPLFLSGMGSSGGSISPSSQSLTFASQLIGSSSAAQSVTLTNTGSAAAAINGIYASGDFSQTNTCGATLSLVASCEISVTFTPSWSGSRSGEVVVNFSDPPMLEVIALSGTGQKSKSTVAISPAQASLTPTQTVQFEATISGVASSDVTWSIDGIAGGNSSVGTISTAGLYTPPSSAGEHTVEATSIANSTQSASGPVFVTANPGILTQHNDNGRTGQNLDETVLSTANVNKVQFGKVASYPLDGYVYAQPLYVADVTIPSQGVHNVVYVATENDSVFAIDADTTTLLWQTSFLVPGSVTTIPDTDLAESGGGDLVPQIGITSTPVIDLTLHALFVVAATKEYQSGSGTYQWVQRLHALNIATGGELPNSPVVIEASIPGSGAGTSGGYVSFNPLLANQRPGLLLLNGVVYLSWGSHNDQNPFHGWVMGYNESSMQRVSVFNVTPNGREGGIWQGGLGTAADASGNIYVATSNGTFDANLGGTDYSDSFLQLSTADGDLAVADYFAPYNQGIMFSDNLDLGSGGVMLLPTQPGPFPDLLIGGGKTATIYLVNRNSMGGYGPGSDNVVQELADALDVPAVEVGVRGGPAYWNGQVYFAGVGDVVKAFGLSNGLLSTFPISESPTKNYYPGATPTVSSNGSTDGVVWVLETDGYGTNKPAILHAYDANNLGDELYNSKMIASRDSAGFAVKFAVPTVANGKVYVGTQTEMDVYGLLP
ncbi:MAG: choice-of-anchor D domain-containing protein [Candidatus Sulfotelmatobacter sp.]